MVFSRVKNRENGADAKLLSEMQSLQAKLDEMKRREDTMSVSSNSEEILMQEIRKLQGTIYKLERKTSRAFHQNEAMRESQQKLEMEIQKSNTQFSPTVFEEVEEEPIDSLLKGAIDVVAANGVKWTASGYSSVVPHQDLNYFPSLEFGPRNQGLQFDYTEGKIISTIVPCYNEGSAELERTIRSLYRQRLPRGWRVEVVIVMDGADHMDSSMSEKLYGLFGVKFNSGDPNTDPLAALPEAETIIVEPASRDNAYLRTAAMEGTVGGYTLVVKRHNHRKANSQMWWLGPHGQFLNAKYSLATDCGTVFARTATIHLIRRLDAEPNLHAVTGYQRVMTSEMQGDGNWEMFHRPFDFLLRMAQRFEFEVRDS